MPASIKFSVVVEMSNDGARKKYIGGANFNEEMNQKGTVFITHRIHILQSHKS